MIGSKKLKVKTTMGGRWGFTTTENQSKLLVISFILLVPIGVSHLGIERPMIPLAVQISPTTIWELSYTPGTERNHRTQCGTRKSSSSERPWSESVVHKC